jgi:hypothetical protein
MEREGICCLAVSLCLGLHLVLGSYDARGQSEMAIKVSVNVDDEGGEQRVEDHWQKYHAVYCALDEAECEWPSIVIVSERVCEGRRGRVYLLGFFLVVFAYGIVAERLWYRAS